MDIPPGFADETAQAALFRPARRARRRIGNALKNLQGNRPYYMILL
ncbi:hypothetical protein B4135_3465 [Caldibacillus debilis]|uniref:Uncharacterized protein n=1 Tax=Caldibacillus debilis TaxID=301148 RepID=A0A150LDI9_9BACI|nr:hypothetical protein B4135_3465 [Caldibacillus debilis]